jgi:gas vesicle protein
MDTQMDTETPRNRDYGFLLGMVTGSLVGAGLAVWFAPRLRAELRDRATKSAGAIGKRAADGYRKASSRVVELTDEVAKRGNRVRDDVADAIAHGAQEVQRVATAARSDRQ